MPATFVGVRHHSPACSRVVARTIESLRPAYVLVEGPADMNDRLDELLLDHELPVAIFSSFRHDEISFGSWAPLCDYSPEWVALTTGHAVGATVRFVDLPAWHRAMSASSNRYADAELRHAEVVVRLCRELAVDNVDTLWDHLFEVEADDIEERLSAYFRLLRGDAEPAAGDAEREEFMARWVRAAVADAGDRAVVVVTGGFHRPAIEALCAEPEHDADTAAWPDVPSIPDGATGGSYLVPFSFKRLDAFDGYQSGMPSPAYYQRLWESGLQAAGAGLVEAVATRLRERHQPVSTSDLIAASTLSSGLARLRGHPVPARADVLDGLAGALVSEVVDVPLPWTSRGPLTPGTHPVVVEMVAALSGSKVGRLHPDTPLPPLVHDVEAELARWRLDGERQVHLGLTTDHGLGASRVLHRLRVLGIPGFQRLGGPTTGIDPVLDEHWHTSASDLRLPALIEAGAYGRTLTEAASAMLEVRAHGASADNDLSALAATLFDAALCGTGSLTDRLVKLIRDGIGDAVELGEVGAVLAVVLGLWRHDHLFGTAGAPGLASVAAALFRRGLWLAEGIRGGPAPAEPARLHAVVALRDTARHSTAIGGVDGDVAVAVMSRITADASVPPDLRGAAFGFCWSLGSVDYPVRALRGNTRPDTLGDWLAGLFALAREEVVASDSAGTSVDDDDEAGSILAVLDRLLTQMSDHDFLVALPALRLAFGYFPPRERHLIATHVLDRRGVQGSAQSLLRIAVAPDVVARSAALEERADAELGRHGLLRPESPESPESEA